MGDWLSPDSAPKDGRVIRVKYDLTGLDDTWDSEINVWWNSGIERWVWEGRACRSYSEGWPIVGWQEAKELMQPRNWGSII